LGCRLTSVEQRRRKLHIRSVNPRRPLPDAWTPEQSALLGTAPDADIARRLGRTVTAITLRRSRLGIPNPHNQFRPFTAEEISLLGKFSDEEVARKTGRPAGSVSAKRRLLDCRNPTLSANTGHPNRIAS